MKQGFFKPFRHLIWIGTTTHVFSQLMRLFVSTTLASFGLEFDGCTRVVSDASRRDDGKKKEKLYLKDAFYF